MPPLLHVRSWRLSTTADRERRSTASARCVDPAAREDSPQIKQVQLTPKVTVSSPWPLVLSEPHTHPILEFVAENAREPQDQLREFFKA